MYTECPECESAFRVTAKVLQRANGSVRCESCGHKFSALDYLSEEMPTPAGDESPATDGDTMAETSRRLLETLNELAGPEKVQIEDTGIEWRVLETGGQDMPQPNTDSSGERRYDDNTPLPDEFDSSAGADNDYSRPSPNQAVTEAAGEAVEETPEKQGDLQLSEPGDWSDLLDEVQDPESDLLQIEEELAAIHEQLSPKDKVADAGPADLDSQFDTQAQKMGLDVSASLESLPEQTPEMGDGVEIVAEVLSKPDIDAESAPSDPQDSGKSTPPVQSDKSSANDSDLVAATEIELAKSDVAGEDDEPSVESGAALEDDGQDTAADESAVDAETADEDEFPGAKNDLDETDSVEEDAELSNVRHAVPEQTEEEMMINMEIDREMMSAASPDDEFSATLVGTDIPQQTFDENAAAIETIIMEGEQIRGVINEQSIELDRGIPESTDKPIDLANTYATSRQTLRGGRRKDDPPAFKTLAAIAVLSIVLIAQAIHNSRESLATTRLFAQVVAPVYQFLGSPVTPDWNVKGWQFEVTSGSVDENETALTIVSRIVNKAEQALPYPLVHVSLVDRWEEVMGSRVLGPDEYLAGDQDPEQAVQPGEKFTAVVTIAEPSADATGFKLEVCYRVAPGSVRCAIEDFKN